MGTVAAARSPQRPVHPAGLHPAGNEVVTGGEELPALGQFDVAVLRAPQPVLGVVHVEVQAVEIAVGHDPSVVDRRDRDAPQPSSLGCRTGLRVPTQPCRSWRVAMRAAPALGVVSMSASATVDDANAVRRRWWLGARIAE